MLAEPLVGVKRKFETLVIAAQLGLAIALYVASGGNDVLALLEVVHSAIELADELLGRNN